MVAAHDLSRQVVEVRSRGFGVPCPAPGTDGDIGGEEHLHRGIGEHDGPDVPALDHGIAAARRHPGTLHSHECGTHQRVRRNQAHGSGDVRGAQALGHVDSIEEDPPLGPEVDLYPLESSQHAGVVAGVDTCAEADQRGEALVHARIEMRDAERGGSGAGSRALPPPARSVYRDDHTRSSVSANPGQETAAVSTPITRTVPAAVAATAALIAMR